MNRERYEEKLRSWRRGLTFGTEILDYYYYPDRPEEVWQEELSEGFPYDYTLKDVVVYHYLVDQKIENQPEDGYISPADETVGEATGSSADQAVLLASILNETVRSPIRIVRLENEVRDTHHIVEINEGWKEEDLPELRRELVDLYGDVLPPMFSHDAIFGFEIESGYTDTPWLIADPVHGEYIGDITGLEAAGWVETRGSKWRWTTQPEYVEIDAGSNSAAWFDKEVKYRLLRWLADLAPDYDYSIDGDQELEFPEWDAEYGSVWGYDD